MSSASSSTGEPEMSFLVRQISLTADGREIVRAAMIAKPQLSLGRAAESDIHLPDLALEPDHARIEQVSERAIRSEEHTSELQSLIRISYAVFCLKKKNAFHHQSHTL